MQIIIRKSMDLLTYSITNSLHDLWNPEVQCRIQKGFPIIPILSRINPIPRIEAYFFSRPPDTEISCDILNKKPWTDDVEWFSTFVV